ncbi:MAG: hypothetical protein WBP12_00910 [Candidatus Saccharimonas sp.]
MRSFRVLGHQAKYIGAAFIMLVATFTPLLVTQVASAAQLTDRSVQLSSSSRLATAVSYQFTFTAEGATTDAGVLVEFCTNTPLIGEACTAPDGTFSVASGNVTGGTKEGTWTANKAIIEKSIAASANTFTITGVANPATAGTVYARVITYASVAALGSNTTASPGTFIDNGSVGFFITDTIGVTGDVLESLTFCVSGAVIADACVTPPTSTAIVLGEEVGVSTGIFALTPDAISQGSVYTHLTTNASGGAIVRLKTGNACGGLVRAGESTCEIAASGADTDWGETNGEGEAKFGVKVNDGVSDLGGATGALVVAGDYNNVGFNMNNAGVISTYGDPILTTSGAPATGQNAQLTFGASIAPNTPAGRYSAALSLIATGTF